MLNLDRTIVNAYEIERMTPEVIADDLGISLSSVKKSLVENSSEFRKAVKADKEFFSSEEINRIAQALYRIALDDAPEAKSAAVKAGIFLINEAKGRNDVRSNGTNLQININVVQERLKNMKRVIESKEEVVKVEDI